MQVDIRLFLEEKRKGAFIRVGAFIRINTVCYPCQLHIAWAHLQLMPGLVVHLLMTAKSQTALNLAEKIKLSKLKLFCSAHALAKNMQQ